MKKEDWKIVEDGNVTSPKGFRAGGIHCGIKRKRLDLGWIVSEVPAAAAAVYTTNRVQAAPLRVTRESIAVEQTLQGILVNSGNANACTGEPGLKDAYEMRKLFADLVGVPQHYIAVASTGVIGERLPMEKIRAGLEEIGKQRENETAQRFAEAILTTDTCTKQLAVQLEIDGVLVTIGGAAKGSGMIHPNMATMLAFLTTDAHVGADDLHLLLRRATDQTFNMITVDGDTSTNDMVLVLANGMAENRRLTPEHPQWDRFAGAFTYVCQELAKLIARDGEGATKLIEVHVDGAVDVEAARRIGKTVVGSNLVKTAVFGTDPNWGRIVCAVGYSGQEVDPERITVSLGPITVVENGLPVPFDEEAARNYLKEEVVQIFIRLNQGDGQAVAWGCDLSYDYVRINASYRT